MNTKNYVFQQLYNYGENWDGELINIPDNAIFYNIIDTWYIIIPNYKKKEQLEDEPDIEDYGSEYLGTGCAQVTCYLIDNYLFITLKNIIPDDWNSIDDNELLIRMNDFFKQKYVSCYKRAKYVLNHDKLINDNLNNIDVSDLFDKVENEELRDVYKIIGLYDDDIFIVIRVTIYDDYDAMITTSHLSMNRISEDLVGFDSEDYKYVIENDDKNFNEHLNKALNILIK